MKAPSARGLTALFASLLAAVVVPGCPVCEGGETETVHVRLPPANPGGSPAPAFDPEVVPEEDCIATCGAGYIECYATSVGNVPAIGCVQRFDCGGAGRRPRGLRSVAVRQGSPEGAWLARTAHLEAASVLAFEQLEDELRGLGAPVSLLRGARRAALEETSHARVMSRLAARFGAVVPRARARSSPPRRPLDVALQNAVVGCVEETFAALVAQHQSEHATDLQVRRSLRRIAREEASHAALAFRVATFLAGRLDPRERRRVDRAAHRAVARLASTWSVDERLVGPLGLPSAAKGRALARALGEALLPRGGHPCSSWASRGTRGNTAEAAPSTSSASV